MSKCSPSLFVRLSILVKKLRQRKDHSEERAIVMVAHHARVPGVRRSRPAAAMGMGDSIMAVVEEKRMEEYRKEERVCNTCCEVKGVEKQPQNTRSDHLRKDKQFTLYLVTVRHLRVLSLCQCMP